MTNNTGNKEIFRINGEEVWKKIKELFRAGMLRHIIFKNKSNEKLFSITVSIAVIIAIILPQPVIILTLVLFILGYSVVVEKEEKSEATASAHTDTPEK